MYYPGCSRPGVRQRGAARRVNPSYELIVSTLPHVSFLYVHLRIEYIQMAARRGRGRRAVRDWSDQSVWSDWSDWSDSHTSLLNFWGRGRGFLFHR